MAKPPKPEPRVTPFVPRRRIFDLAPTAFDHVPDHPNLHQWRGELVAKYRANPAPWPDGIGAWYNPSDWTDDGTLIATGEARAAALDPAPPGNTNFKPPVTAEGRPKPFNPRDRLKPKSTPQPTAAIPNEEVAQNKPTPSSVSTSDPNALATLKAMGADHMKPVTEKVTKKVTEKVTKSQVTENPKVTKTISVTEEVTKKKGRPPKATTLSNAERQRRYKQRLKDQS